MRHFLKKIYTLIISQNNETKIITQCNMIIILRYYVYLFLGFLILRY